MIAVIDNSYSNLKSISNALSFLNFSYQIIKAENLTEKYSHTIIPGVGNFSNTMQHLIKNGGKKKNYSIFKNKKANIGNMFRNANFSYTG